MNYLFLDPNWRIQGKHGRTNVYDVELRYSFYIYLGFITEWLIRISVYFLKQT